MRELSIFLLLGLLWSPLAKAADAPLVVIQDKVQLLRLVAPAHRVIVGNPAIADVTVEQPGLIYVFGKMPGETSLTILGTDDQEIVSRSVVVTSAADRAVTVHLPGSQGPITRQYSCVGERCAKLAASDSAAAPTAAAPTAVDATVPATPKPQP